jgi:hypothetical protein
MAPNGVISQLLPLVQWRAWARANYNCTCNYLSVTVGLSGSQAELDWQWIRVCLADSRADLRDCQCQWPSSELNAASLQLLSGQLGLHDCHGICASDEVMSNLKFSTLNLKLEVVVTVAVCTATSPCAKSRLSPFSYTPVPITLAMVRRRWSAWKLAPPTISKLGGTNFWIN